MVLAAVIVLLLQNPADNGGVFYSYVNDTRWESIIPAADLATSPRWPPGADSPPLAPRAAVRSARLLLDTIFTAGEKWELNCVSLQQIHRVPDSWVYPIDFGERPPLPEGGPGTLGSFMGEQMTVVVLMDGTALRPSGHPLKR